MNRLPPKYAVVVSGTDEDVIRREARALAERYWNARADFSFSVPAGDADWCITTGLGATARPYFISDSGDNPTAGGVGDSPRFLRRAERKLRKAQKALSRTAKDSSNRDKARVKVARVHAKVADCRRDWLHKESTRIIRENQAVYVEDLCVRGLARTRLAKSVHDVGWSAFTTMLEYKARRHGREFSRTGRFEPTSQLCSACGARDGPKPLSVRTWTCAACGTAHDRDVNAARNILALGRRERLNACGTGVRPPLTVAAGAEAGTHRSAA